MSIYSSLPVKSEPKKKLKRRSPSPPDDDNVQDDDDVFDLDMYGNLEVIRKHPKPQAPAKSSTTTATTSRVAQFLSSAPTSTTTAVQRADTGAKFRPPEPPVAKPPPPPVVKKATAKEGPPKKKASVNDWPGLAEISRISGIRSVTCVDPGTRNLALMRVEFAPLRITHARVIDLVELSTELELSDATVRLRSNRGPIERLSFQTASADSPEYSMQTLLYALRRYVHTEAAVGSGGCFDSDMCLVEEQSFDRLMARVEATIITAFEATRGDKAIVEILAGVEGGRIPAAQVVTAHSVKTCYRHFFPKLKEESEGGGRSGAGGEAAAARKRAFGIGNVQRDPEEKQRAFNKKNAIKYGSMIVAPDRFKVLVPAANFTDADRRRMEKGKMDDLYDTLFMCMYFASTYMFKIAKVRTRGISRPLPALETPEQRPDRRYEEVFEFAIGLRSGNDVVQMLTDTIFGVQ